MEGGREGSMFKSMWNHSATIWDLVAQTQCRPAQALCSRHKRYCYLHMYVQYVRYMSQVTCRFPQACRVGNSQMAARQVVNFRARSADWSCGIHGKRKILRGSWHHLHVGCY